MLRDADRALSAEHRGALRSLLLRADRVIPAGAPYAATSAVRSDNARYYLYPRPRLATGFDRSSLRRSGCRKQKASRSSPRPTGFIPAPAVSCSCR